MTTAGRVRVGSRVDSLLDQVNKALDWIHEKEGKRDLSFAAIEKRIAWLELPLWRRAWLRLRGRR